MENASAPVQLPLAEPEVRNEMSNFERVVRMHENCTLSNFDTGYFDCNHNSGYSGTNIEDSPYIFGSANEFYGESICLEPLLNQLQSRTHEIGFATKY